MIRIAVRMIANSPLLRNAAVMGPAAQIGEIQGPLPGG
jgi:hypothetical protein